jgi:hypothetical protein
MSMPVPLAKGSVSTAGTRRELSRTVRPVRAVLAVTVTLGMVAATLTVVQMALLSHLVAQVFLAHANRARVAQPLLLLLAVILAHAATIWLREVSAQRGAIRV